jgi:hypothetical protein
MPPAAPHGVGRNTYTATPAAGRLRARTDLPPNGGGGIRDVSRLARRQRRFLSMIGVSFPFLSSARTGTLISGGRSAATTTQSKMMKKVLGLALVAACAEAFSLAPATSFVGRCSSCNLRYPGVAPLRPHSMDTHEDDVLKHIIKKTARMLPLPRRARACRFVPRPLQPGCRPPPRPSPARSASSPRHLVSVRSSLRCLLRCLHRKLCY